MGQIIKCDICGKIYNESHLTTHKRRSHGIPGTLPRSAENGKARVEAIFFLYERLPDEQKKQVLERLAAGEQTKR